MAIQLRSRSEIPVQYTWDLSTMFPSDAAWQKELEAVHAAVPKLAAFQGTLGDSGARLADYLRQSEALTIRSNKVGMYALLKHDGDTLDAEGAGFLDRAHALGLLLETTLSFAVPEILALGRTRVEALCGEVPELATRAHYFNELFRLAPHVRSAEVEEVLALSGEATSAATNAYRALADTDLVFNPVARGAERIDVSQGTIDDVLRHPDPAVRRAGWESYADGFRSVRNTMAYCLAGAVKADLFRARARRYESTLDQALFRHDIPHTVYDVTLDAARAHLPIWHRYFRAKKKLLGLDTFHQADLAASLTSSAPSIPYDSAVDLIIEGMKPLGPEYVEPLTRGLRHERWADVYPSRGKRSNAYSAGTFGTNPFLLLNFSDTLPEVSILAHELGHSMHTYLTCRHQPYCYTDYSLFAAEVASNFNQAMVRAHLLKTATDRALRLAVLEEAFANFARYLFTMPLLGRFEREVHRRAQEGGSLTADDLDGVLLRLLQEAYGGEVTIDPPRSATMWAQFGHLHVPFYVYQYATGISAGNALAKGVLEEHSGARERYLGFLKAGSSLPPIAALRQAGVDMETPAPMAAAFKVLEGFITELEALA